MATLADLMIKLGIDTKGVDKGTRSVEGKLKKSWGTIKAGALAGGALAGAALMQGMQSVIETSKPLALLNAQLGATGPLAEDLGKAAGDLFRRGVVDSMETATAAVRDTWRNGLVMEDATQEEIARVARHLSTLSTIAEEESGQVSNAVKQMMRNGLVANAEEGLDLLTRGVQEGVNKAGDLFDTMNEYGTQFRQLGLDGAQSMGLMNQAIRAGGRDADTAADALKEFAIRAIDGSTTSAEGFKALGLDAEKMTAQIAKGGPAASAGLGTVLDRLREMKDPVKQNAAAVALFGTKAEDLGQALFAMDLNTAADGLGNVAGAAERAGKTLEESAGAKLEAFKRKATSALVVELAKAIPYIEKTFGWLSKNSSWVKPLAIGLGALAVVIGIVTIATWAWNAALAVNPITWIVLAIVALIAVIVVVATKTRFFQTIWEAVWGFMKAVGAWFAGPFAGFFVNAWRKITASLSRAKAQFLAVVNFVKNLFMGWVRFNVSVIAKMISNFLRLVNFVRSIPGRIRGALSRMFSPLWQGFRNAINRVISGWNNLKFGIPGFSVGPISFPGISVGTPNIPMLAEGGIATAPTLAMIGEGREDEAIVPLSRLPEVAGRGDQVVVVEIAPGGESEFRRWIRKTIRVKGPLEPSGSVAI